MKYDIIVIGAGSGGLNIAVFMNKIGLKVLLVDKTDRNIGGDCLNTGCIPSKSLIHIARTIYSQKEVLNFGLNVSGDLDLNKIMEKVRKNIELIRKHENADYFKKMGIDVVLGIAKFVNTNEIEVENKKYIGKKIVIATGSRARKLDIPGIENANVLTNENFFELKTLPKKLVVVGTGPIGIELGQTLLMLGSKVTFISQDSRILPKEKENITNILYKKLLAQGAEFLFNQEIVSVEDKNILVTKNKEDNKENKIEFEYLLVAIGRELNIENLDLEVANVLTQKGKIVTDEYLRTTNKSIFVCGDVAGSYQFTHAAEIHAKILLNNFFNPFKKKLSYDNFSWVTYTTPEIATFGLSENELKKRNISYQILSSSFANDDRAITDNNAEGFGEIYINKNGSTILGGTFVANNAGELIQELVLAMEAKLSIQKIFDKIYPYPTATRINKKIVNEYFKERLTGFYSKLLKAIYF